MKKANIFEVNRELPLIVILAVFSFVIMFSAPRGIPTWIIGNVMSGHGTATFTPLSKSDLNRFPTMKKAMKEADRFHDMGRVHPEEYLGCFYGEARRILRFFDIPYSEDVDHYLIPIILDEEVMGYERYFISLHFSYEKPRTV